MRESRLWRASRSCGYLVRGCAIYFAEARVGCPRDYCGYGCCRYLGRNFYYGQRTTSECGDVGRSACAAANVGRRQHYRLVGLGVG